MRKHRFPLAGGQHTACKRLLGVTRGSRCTYKGLCLPELEGGGRAPRLQQGRGAGGWLEVPAPLWRNGVGRCMAQLVVLGLVLVLKGARQPEDAAKGAGRPTTKVAGMASEPQPWSRVPQGSPPPPSSPCWGHILSTAAHEPELPQPQHASLSGRGAPWGPLCQGWGGRELAGCE